jgi:hypothetical protein
MRRREFLAKGGQAVLSLGLGVGGVSMAGCVRSRLGEERPRADRGDADWIRRISRLEEIIPPLLAEAKVAGLSIAIVRKGKLAWRGAFGYQDVETRTPVTFETVFEAASVSKTVFAYAVMKLCERQVLHLDTPLSRYRAQRFLADDPRIKSRRGMRSRIPPGLPTGVRPTFRCGSVSPRARSFAIRAKAIITCSRW